MGIPWLYLSPLLLAGPFLLCQPIICIIYVLEKKTAEENDLRNSFLEILKLVKFGWIYCTASG
jgi:hypothetical protein